MSTEPTNSKQATAGADGPGLLDALVQAERESMDPPADGERQTWERVVASVAVGRPPPIPPANLSAPATAGSLWVKIVLGVIIGGVVAVAGGQLATDSDPAPVATTVPGNPPEAHEPAPVPAPAPQPALSPQPGPRPALAADPPVTAALPPKASPPTTVVGAQPKDNTPETSDLREETRLIARARGRLRAGSPADALAPLTQHADRFPDGQLTEDRLVLQARALCDSGDTKAGLNKAAALRKAFPSSSHLPRVQRACE